MNSPELNWCLHYRHVLRIKNPRSRAIALSVFYEVRFWFSYPKCVPNEQLLIDALKTSGTYVSHLACEAISLTADSHRDPVAYATRLFHASPAGARGHMHWHFRNSPIAHRAITQLGLVDRSKHVRFCACYAVCDAGYMEFVPHLREMAETDRDKDIRLEARVHADMLSHGYGFRERTECGGWCYDTRLGRGSRTWVIVTDEEHARGDTRAAIERYLSDIKERIVPGDSDTPRPSQYLVSSEQISTSH